MNATVSLIALLSIAPALLSFGGGARAANGPKFLFATGQEATVNVVDPGTATCVGGEATGDPFDPCHGSQRILLDHQVVEAVVLTATGDAAALLGGTDTVTIDCNLDGNLRGQCRGVFEWRVDGDSLWAGTLNGLFDFSTFTFSYQMVGRGVGGGVDGMQLRYDVFYDGGYDFIGNFVAFVHAPKG